MLIMFTNVSYTVQVPEVIFYRVPDFNYTLFVQRLFDVGLYYHLLRVLAPIFLRDVGLIYIELLTTYTRDGTVISDHLHLGEPFRSTSRV
jgi:hypothetical protein